MKAVLGKSRTGNAIPCTPRGYRAYAVGDVHGRLDLLDELISKVELDLAERKPRRALLLFLGDLIDRGPASAQVIERLRTYDHRDLRMVFLMGNHEEVLLRLLSGERGILDSWLRFGGAECLASYGADPQSIRTMQEGEALAAVKRAVPESHRKFIAGFADTLRFGGYLFVHAGIRPSVDLTMQSQADLRWIRQPSPARRRGSGRRTRSAGRTSCIGSRSLRPLRSVRLVHPRPLEGSRIPAGCTGRGSRFGRSRDFPPSHIGVADKHALADLDRLVVEDGHAGHTVVAVA